MKVESMDISDILLSFALSIIGGSIGVIIGVWYTQKRLFSAESIMGYADSVLNYAINTEEGKAKLNIIGKWVVSNLMGNVKGSIGGAMPKTKDLLPMLIMGLAQKYMPQLFGPNQPQNQQEQSNPQEQTDKNPFAH